MSVRAETALESLLPGAVDEVRRAFRAGGAGHVQRDLLESVRGFLAGPGGIVAQAVRAQACREAIASAQSLLTTGNAAGALGALAPILAEGGALTTMMGGLAGPEGRAVERLRAWHVVGTLHVLRASGMRTAVPHAELGLVLLRGTWGLAAWGALAWWERRQRTVQSRHVVMAGRWAELVLAGTETLVGDVERALTDVLGGVLHDVTAAVPKEGAC